ncbi:MAG: ABC transporter permease [Nitrospinae bacterium]|nr:ABC transporter permease [Nitrospinota bacterium]
MNPFVLAARNVTRNRLRALVTVGAMGLAGAVMVFYTSLVEGMVTVMIGNIVDMDTGDVQIHREGYRQDPDFYKTIPDGGALRAKLESRGFYVAERLYGFGLLAAGSRSAGVSIRGVDPAHEFNVTYLHRHLLAGEWIADDDPKGVVIGKKLARALGVWVGSEVVAVGQAADGSMANDIYRVRGVLKSVSEGLDRGGLVMTGNAFREFMALPEGAHEIAVKRKNPSANLDEALAAVTVAAPGMEVKDWRQLRPVVARVFELLDVVMAFMILLTYTAIGLVTFNAMLMSVFERIPEFGVMKAIGVSPGQVMGLVLAEALALATAACALALAAGLPVALHYQAHGLDLSWAWKGGSFGGVAFDPIWKAKVTLKTVLEPLVFLFIVAMGAVVYPGIKAAILHPAQAIRHR